MAARAIARREPLYFTSVVFRLFFSLANLGGHLTELVQTLPHVSIWLLFVNAGLKFGGLSP